MHGPKRLPAHVSRPKGVPRRTWTALALVALASVLAAPQVQAQAKMQKLKLINPFNAGISFFPVYVAAELGYFKDENLDVSIVIGEGSGNAIQQLVTGNVDVALASPSPMLAAIARGVKLKSVYVTYQRNPFRLAVPEASPIKSVAELRGKTIGVSSLTGGGVGMTRTMLTEAGLERGSYKLLEVGRVATGMVALQNGTIDAYVAGPSDYIAMENRGLKQRDLVLPKYQTLFDDPVIFQASFVEKNPDVVVGVGRALAKASVWAQANPEGAISLIGRRFAAEAQNRDYAKPFMAEILKLYAPPAGSGGKWGYNDPAAWQLTTDVLVKEGEIKTAIDPKAVYTNEFIDRFNDFDKNAIATEARQFKGK